MKAIVCREYGDLTQTLRLEDVPEPAVGPDDVLVRVHAASLNPLDWHLLTGTPRIGRPAFGLRRPRANGLGADLAGVVAAVGPDVTTVAVGERVFGTVDAQDGGSVPALGTVAELVAVRSGRVHRIPEGVGFAEAAGAGVAATTALRGVRDVAAVQPGQHVVVTGASGGVGHFMVQLARSAGARVTGECSTANLDLVRSLGADDVVDYTTTDVTTVLRDVDVVLDNVGHRSPASWRRTLRRDGVYVASFGQKHNAVLGPLGSMVAMWLQSLVVPQRMVSLPSNETDEQLAEVARLLAAGELRTVVGRTYPMADAAAAMVHVGTGHVRGKTIVTVTEHA